MPPDELPVDPDVMRERADGHAGPRDRRWDIAVVIAAGGALGGAVRWLLNEAVPTSADGFPWATFLENVAGCLVLGALMVFLLDVWGSSRYLRPFLAIGVLGGFTTFSAYSAEAVALVRHGDVPLAVTYVVGTMTVALAATWTGIAVARRLAGVGVRTR